MKADIPESSVDLETIACNFCGDTSVDLSYERGIGLRVVECANCGLAYVSPRPTLDAMLEHYERSYADGVSDDIWSDYLALDTTRSDIARLRKYIQLEGADVLDVGCGAGIFLHALGKEGAGKLVGIEPCTAKVEYARRMMPLAAFHAMPYEAVEMPDSLFDLVCALDLIEHIYDPGHFFAFVARVLRPGGILFVKTPNWNAARHYGLRWEGLWRDWEHVYYFSPRSVSQYLSRMDMQVVYMDFESYQVGFGGTTRVCPSDTAEPNRSILRVLRGFLKRTPALNKAAYGALQAIRRLKNGHDIQLGVAHELIVCARKGEGRR